jgi:hypothetical protein
LASIGLSFLCTHLPAFFLLLSLQLWLNTKM